MANEWLDTLRPREIASYLNAHGWKRCRSFCEDKASLWIAPGDDEMDVLLPLRSNIADFRLRMGALVENVAKTEGRSPDAVLRDFAAVNADVIRVRVIAGGGVTLPFIDGVNLLKKIRDVLAAAALSTLEKRAYFTNRRPETIMEFLEQLQLGQTEYSSYVFTVLSPMPDEGDAAPGHWDGAHSAPREPFGRRVTSTLMHALSAMQNAADIARREGSNNAFVRAVEDGVSANLCDAVVELQSICPDHAIEISLRWACTRKPPEDTASRVVLRQDFVPVIQAASDAFWGMPKHYDFSLEGMVAQLESAEDAPSGSAILMGYVNSRPEYVRAVFEAPAYAGVVDAYRQHLMIHCEGDLVREAGVYTLKNARYFRSR